MGARAATFFDELQKMLVNFDLRKNSLLLLCVVSLMSGCILSDDSPTERRVNDVGVDAGQGEDVLEDVSDATQDDATQEDIAQEDAVGDVGDDTDSGGVECDPAAPSRACLEDALLGKTFATLMNASTDNAEQSGDAPEVGLAVFLEFSQDEQNPCIVDLQFEQQTQGTCALTSNNRLQILVEDENGTLAPVISLDPTFRGGELTALKTDEIPNVGVLDFRPLPETGVRNQLRQELSGAWVEEAGLNDPAPSDSRIGVNFNQDGGRADYGVRFPESGVFLAYIAGDFEIISCGDRACWAIRNAHYQINQPDCVDNCFSVGDAAVSLGGAIKGGETVSAIMLPKVEGEVMSSVQGVRVRPNQ
ncbi:hypothetical protein [Bradymonas sediminis]|uniref:Uncharacterized protein n=1 Tax=Bradymonas sediminis TaxID=1548548 RepID=A0A2Z4FJK9_9DELT|nr:hypothetical protein [Bradymonas sediminis]AWV89040.1 hypothetical protein DN745_06680 [Bradymonas sediminis]TDP64501.1 hypothetical protein DFR33_109165 [Bradymonas sediminis]